MDRIRLRPLLFASVGVVAALAGASCGKTHSGDDQAGNDGSNQFHQDACAGIGCNITNCQGMGMQPTSIMGTVFAPNGKLPLYDVNVYIPGSDPGAFTDGVQCSRCSDALPGNPIVTAVTGTDGSFELDNIPDGDNIPVVVTIGKWRRQLVLPHVGACTQTMIANADTTLPKSRTDMSPSTKSVDLPKIAVSTGGADALECLIRKLGIDDKEISTLGEDGQIHLYADTKAKNGGEGAASFAGGFAGGTGKFADSQTLWGTTEGAGGSNNGDLSTYDIVILSCEGGQHEETKNQAAMDNLKAYADIGGRVFMSHWHNIWIEGDTENSDGKTKPMVWPALATFNDNSDDPPKNTVDVIDETHNPKGSDFATWMQDPQVMGSTTRDDIAIEDGTQKETCTSVEDANVERWVNLAPAGSDAPQMFQFETPNEVDPSNRCGKVVFSDMHVSGDSSSPHGGTFPTGCAASDLTPQEKALAFMFFDISSCAGAPIE
jgi:hypothetical protein|nr:hypothetical protein [Kofleriaceae bacterium]